MKVWDLWLQRFFIGKCSPWHKTHWSRSELQHFCLLSFWCFSYWFYLLCYLGFTYLFTLSPVATEQNKCLIVRGLIGFSGWVLQSVFSALSSWVCCAVYWWNWVKYLLCIFWNQPKVVLPVQCLSVSTIFPILMFLWQDFFFFFFSYTISWKWGLLTLPDRGIFHLYQRILKKVFITPQKTCPGKVWCVTYVHVPFIVVLDKCVHNG